MKKFRDLMFEVARPKSEDEQAFIDKHVIDVFPHPYAFDHQHTGEIVNKPIKKTSKRLADYAKGEDEIVYEAKLDPVGQEDDDINNDGRVDDTDSYLHNRRKTIAKAMSKRMNERVVEPYAVGMAAAMKATGDEPPLEKSTIRKAHKIAKAIQRNEEVHQMDEETNKKILKAIHADFQSFKNMSTPAVLTQHKTLRKVKGPYSAQEVGGKLAMVSDILRNKYGAKHVDHYFTLGKKGLENLMNEEVELDKVIDLGGGNKVHVTDKSAKNFSNEYVLGHKRHYGRYLTNFKNTYHARDINDGPYSSHDSTIYTHKKTGDKFLVKRKVKTTTPYVADHFVSKLNEEVELDEAMRLDRVNIVHHDAPSIDFAKEYVKGHRGDYESGGPTEKQRKDSDKFHATYTRVDGNSGFAGSGHDIYRHNKTGKKYRIDRQANGKGFYGTDHHISEINEEVELDEAKVVKIGKKDAIVGQFGGSKGAKLLAKASKGGYYDLHVYNHYTGEANPLARGIHPKGFEAAVSAPHHAQNIKRAGGLTLDHDVIKKLHEEVELDEGGMRNPAAIGALIRKGKQGNIRFHGPSGYWRIHDKEGKIVKTGQKFFTYTDAKKWHDANMKTESVELDEISKSTLGSYATKALQRGDIAARMSHSDSDDMGKIATKRITGVKKAVDKLTGKKTAASIKSNIDKAREAARNRYTDADDQGKAYYAAQKGISKIREEVEQIDEISDKLKAKYLDKAVADNYDRFTGRGKYEKQKDSSKYTKTGRSKKSALNSPESLKYREKIQSRGEVIDKVSKDLTGKPHYGFGDTNAADWWKGKKYAKEETDLIENFKAGSVKLNDGSSVLLKDQDAKLLNQLFNDLNSTNRKSMMKVAMTDKNGFNEILGFAREAL